ncbi:MAG: hypothetical protein ACLTG0_02805 [Oscillibacter sp.]
MDKKDEIILQQLDVIRTMTQNNLNRMGSDFWGTPLTPDAPKSAVPKEAAPKANAPKSADGAKPNKPAASTGADEKKEEEAPLPPPEKIEDLKKELDGYIGLAEVKREVNNPHQHGDGVQAARGSGTAERGLLAPHGLYRQPRHGQDDDRAADGAHLPLARHFVEGPARRGGPQRAGRGLRRTDGHQDGQGH